MKESNLKILYDDAHIIIIDKPGGLLAVPGRGIEKLDSVATRLVAQFPGIIDQPAVHRLDMFTSGVMVYAKTKEAHRHLSIQFEQRATKKEYEALLEGTVKENHGEIRLKFRLDLANRPLQIHDPEKGKLGITVWKKLAVSNGQTRVHFTPLTGRTHQLRIHSAHPKKLGGLGSPIVGDSLYGKGKDGDKMYLHATSLSFIHPTDNKIMQFYSPPDF